MKLLQNKIVVGGICIFMAAVFAFVLLPSINKSKGMTVSVIKLQTDVAAGTKIEEAMLKDVEVGAYGLPESVIKDKSQIVGKYAKKALHPDELLLSGCFSDYATDDKLDKIMEQGKKLVSVTVSSNAASVANHIKAGDSVSFYCYIDGNTVTYPELKSLEVYSVENSESVNAEQSSDDNGEKRAETVTLVVTEEQAVKLVYAEYSGKLHAVFERRGGLQ